MYIGIDFDGTCVTHSFPDLGKEIGAVPVLKRLVKNGHQLILFTMRSNMLSPKTGVDPNITLDTKGHFLNIAIRWFNDNNIPLYGIQTNPTQKSWTSSPKAYCHLYIDDAGIGCPLINNSKVSKRPFVDWEKVEKILKDQGIINH